MASGDQIKAMLRAYKDADENQLMTLALQIAAREAKAGHNKLAGEIRELVDQVKAHGPDAIVISRKPTPIRQPKGELADLVHVVYPETQLDDLILEGDTRSRLDRVLHEQRQSSLLAEHGLEARRKLLLIGPPGTGKTVTAAALASSLSLPLFTLRLDSLFTRYMGEATAKLRLIFDSIQQVRGVYLFDEFDAIGQQRATANDIGELRRILNAFLQLVEQDASNSLIVAATNHPKILDAALFRRFDDVLQFSLPTPEEFVELMRRRTPKKYRTINWDAVAKLSDGLSYADARRAYDDAMKGVIVSGGLAVTTEALVDSINERIKDRKTFTDNN
jgi:SpoVK/Ycf46/Vps4 family AAA+-type ATPase